MNIQGEPTISKALANLDVERTAINKTDILSRREPIMNSHL